MKQLNNRGIVSLFLFWRVLLFAPILIAQNISLRAGFNYTTIFHYIPKSGIISNFLIYPWGNFDGIYYLYIAGSGYTPDNAGFFPLYPMLVKIFSLNSQVFSFNQFLTAITLSSLFFLLSLIMLHRLIKLDYSNNIAMSTILAILVFPTSFFFASIYSESLFLLLLILSFYFARKRNWLLASIFAALLTATRLVGIAIIPALVYEFYLQNKTIVDRKLLPILMTPLGILSYVWFNYSQLGDSFRFLKAQGNLHNNRSVEQIILFPQTLFRYLKILSTNTITFEWWIALLELLSFLFASVMIYYAFRKKVRASYLIFSLIAFLIPTQTETFSGLPRYIIVLFPIFLGLALIRNKAIRVIYMVISIALLIVLFAFFSKGYFIA